MAWMALAMMGKRRLWLVGEVSEHATSPDPAVDCARETLGDLLEHRCRALARHTLTLHEGMFVVAHVAQRATDLLRSPSAERLEVSHQVPTGMFLLLCLQIGDDPILH